MPSRTVEALKRSVAADAKADDATAQLAEVDTTQPLDQRTDGAAIVKATANGQSHRDAAYGDLIALVHHAERHLYEVQTALQLQTELDNARRQMQARRHVDPATVGAIKRLADAWDAQISSDGDGS